MLSRVHLPCKLGVRLDEEMQGVGVWVFRSLTVSEILAIESFTQNQIVAAPVQSFERMIFRGMILHTVLYSLQLKINDAFVKMRGSTHVFAINSCVVLTEAHGMQSKEVLLLLKVFRALPLSCNDATLRDLSNPVYKIDRNK